MAAGHLRVPLVNGYAYFQQNSVLFLWDDSLCGGRRALGLWTRLRFAHAARPCSPPPPVTTGSRGSATMAAPSVTTGLHCAEHRVSHDANGSHGHLSGNPGHSGYIPSEDHQRQTAPANEHLRAQSGADPVRLALYVDGSLHQHANQVTSRKWSHFLKGCQPRQPDGHWRLSLSSMTRSAILTPTTVQASPGRLDSTDGSAGVQPRPYRTAGLLRVRRQRYPQVGGWWAIRRVGRRW